MRDLRVLQTEEDSPLKGSEVTKTLVCIELPSQIQIALKEVQQRDSSHTLLLALTPQVEYALEKRGLACCRPEDYHCEEDITSVGLEDLATLEKFCDAVDDFVQSRWDILREHGIRPAKLNWYYLKNLFNSVSIRAFIMRRILEVERPQQILYFGTQEEPVGRELWFMRESVWSRTVPLASSALNIPCESLGDDTDPRALNRCPGFRAGELNIEFKKLGRRLLGPEGVRRMKTGYRGVKILYQRLRSPRRNGQLSIRPTILALESTFSLEHLLCQIESQGSFNTLRWNVQPVQSPYFLDHAMIFKNWLAPSGLLSRPALREKSKRLGEEMRSIPAFRSFFQFSAIDCFPALERRLVRFFEVDLPELVYTYLNARALLRAERPIAVLAATMGDYGRQAVALAARNENIPFVVYRHGDSGGHMEMEIGVHPINETIELLLPHYVLVFGEGDVKYFNNSERRIARIVPVGSAVLDHLKKPSARNTGAKLRRKFGLSPDKKLVVYALTDMEGNIRIAPYRGRSPSLTYQIQRKLLEVFSEFPHIQFVLKLHVPPGHPCSPIAQEVKDRRLVNCVTMTEPLTSLLPMADMFITDYPTTSFLEMLTTDRPILVCGYQLPRRWAADWHPSVLEMWKERVVYADDLEEFLELLRVHLKEERFQPVQSANTLLKLFGTHLDDGQSVHRAHVFLESLAGAGVPEDRENRRKCGRQQP